MIYIAVQDIQAVGEKFSGQPITSEQCAEKTEALAEAIQKACPTAVIKNMLQEIIAVVFEIPDHDHEAVAAAIAKSCNCEVEPNVEFDLIHPVK